jgi:mycothiol synthase
MPQVTIFTIPIPTLYMVWPQTSAPAPPTVALPAGYRLRPYTAADADAYCDLVNIDGWADAGWRCHEKTLRSMLTRTLPAGLLLVEHEASGALVATAAARHRPEADDYYFPFGGEISLVFVHPDHRRQGLGRAITAAALMRLIEIGYQHIYLNTTDKRLPALRLYLTMGFVPFLYEEDLMERWQEICAELNWPFTPEQWPSTLVSDEADRD